MKTRRIIIKGVVQGVGFRPFLYRLAKTLNLVGEIKNTPSGVELILSGAEKDLADFIKILPQKAPPNSSIREIILEEVTCLSSQTLKITKGGTQREVELDLLPDLAICKDCRLELEDFKNRRFRHPFIACTNCGPRYGMLLSLPYERENTTMGCFSLCAECLKEYTDPLNRRFQAETIACHHCGPKVRLYSGDSLKFIAQNRSAIEIARTQILEGMIIAVKGLTGFHLLCRADLPRVITKLRKRKRRPTKPLAVMFPNLEVLKRYALVDEADLSLLLSPQSPIVLVKRKEDQTLPMEIAEGTNFLGVLLPYTPLHLLLLEGFDFPVVATSGNLSDEPLLFTDEAALEKLKRVADYFLLHDRKILRGSDDSVVKKVANLYVMIRRGRGYAPYPQILNLQTPVKCLALGSQEKNTFALGIKNRIVVSPHIGDLSNPETYDYYVNLIKDYLKLYRIENLDLLVCDLHPNYESTKLAKRWAKQEGIPLLQVQHHHSHLLSVLAEFSLIPEEETLGFAWDGTGYGLDHSIWGGETLILKGLGFHRIRSLRPFRLLGGEAAVKDTRRVALSLLFATYGEKTFGLKHPLLNSFSEGELSLLFQAWVKGINSPWCTSCGRLFDAVAALSGVCYRNTYEGEAPVKLEALYRPQSEAKFPYSLEGDFYFDWEPMVRNIVEKDFSPREIITRFINTLAQFLIDTVLALGYKQVLISGGVMVNGPLLKRLIDTLEPLGIRLLRNEKFPPLDGGISLGQAYFGMLTSVFAQKGTPSSESLANTILPS